MTVVTNPTRTRERPMAFTFEEFWIGAAIAWALILLGLWVMYAWELFPETGAGSYCASVFGGPMRCDLELYWWNVLTFPLVVIPVSALFVAILSPLGGLLGGFLIPHRGVRLHIAMFTSLGALLGVGWMLLARLACFPPFGPLGIGTAAVITLAVPAGWALTARRALTHDRSTAS